MRTPFRHLLKRTGPWLAVLLLPLAAHAQAPANDDPAGAIALSLGSTCTPTTATTTGATTTAAAGLGYTNPGCGVAVNPKDVWFTFTTAAAGQPGSTSANIVVAGIAAGQVRVFSSAGGAAGPFTSVDCAAGPDVSTQAPPLYLRSLTAATTYYVFVSGFGSASTQGAFTICATTAPANDVAVEAVQTLTQLPIPQGAPHVVRAVVTNRGTSAQTNVQVTLTVTGANAFTNTQTVASLAVGTPTTVSFAGFTPTATGTNTVAVSVPADDQNANNSLAVAQAVNTTTYSYATAPGSVGSRGYGPTTVYNVNAARFSASTALSVTQVRAYLVDGATGAGSTVGKTVYGVLLDGGGNVLARSTDYVVTAADINTYVSFPLPTPYVRLPAGSDIYVGLAQTYQPGQTTQYYALGTQRDGTGRTGAFYATSTVSATPIPPYDVSQQFSSVKLMLEAVTTATTGTATRNEALAATVGLYPNPAHGAFALAVPAGPLGTAVATLRNALGQVVQTRPLHLPAAGGTAEFDVRGLAPGVYTLQLLTGETLVVKRVVVE